MSFSVNNNHIEGSTFVVVVLLSLVTDYSHDEKTSDIVCSICTSSHKKFLDIYAKRFNKYLKPYKSYISFKLTYINKL